MDSPIFGSQKSSHNNKARKYPDYSTANSEINPSEWYVTSKNSNNSTTSQISNDLKLAYTLLILQKNFKVLSSKIYQWYFFLQQSLNKKKNEAFHRIWDQSKRSAQSIQKGSKQLYKSTFETVNNPEIRSLAIVCAGKVNQKISNLYYLINRLKLKRIAKAWSCLYIMMEKNHLPVVLNEYSSCVVTFLQFKESDLGICSKIQTKKNLNSKKHAKQMKENSILNQTNSEFDIDNQKLIIDIIHEEKMIDNFTQKMNALLAHHETILPSDSDRETLLSDNGISHSSLQNHVKSRKNQPTKKR